MGPVKNVDEYIASSPKEIQVKLKKIREIIKEFAPDAEEKIGYGMPGYKLEGRPLVYFAAFKSHIGLYPTSSVIEDTIPEVFKYRTGKGTLQFSTNEPLPISLIRKVIEFRVNENLEGKKK